MFENKEFDAEPFDAFVSRMSEVEKSAEFVPTVTPEAKTGNIGYFEIECFDGVWWG
jgi:hypothetical protein